jgi:putative holliday junction resolvase
VSQLTATGRVLAVDPGTVRVGVSVSDSERTMAFPRPALEADDALLDALAAMVEEEDVVSVVVGLPRSLDGSEGPAAARSRMLADALRHRLPAEVEVVLVDERLTTVEAAASLRRAGQDARRARGSIDSAAATVLLESWLAAR